eukprot:g25251.t1
MRDLYFCGRHLHLENKMPASNPKTGRRTVADYVQANAAAVAAGQNVAAAGAGANDDDVIIMWYRSRLPCFEFASRPCGVSVGVKAMYGS